MYRGARAWTVFAQVEVKIPILDRLNATYDEFPSLPVAPAASLKREDEAKSEEGAVVLFFATVRASLVGTALSYNTVVLTP